MFASGIIARSAYHWQIWVEACGGTEQAVTAYAVRPSKNSPQKNTPLIPTVQSNTHLFRLVLGKFVV